MSEGEGERTFLPFLPLCKYVHNSTFSRLAGRPWELAGGHENTSNFPPHHCHGDGNGM